MSDYTNFPIFVEKQLQTEYLEGTISNGGEFWLQINCAHHQTLQVSNYSLVVVKTKMSRLSQLRKKMNEFRR
jgi:hypothetical protein